MITKSDDLCLRYYRLGDEGEIYQYTSDIESSKFLARKPHESALQTKDMLLNLSAPSSFGQLGKCIWLITSVTNQQAMGYLTSIKKDDSVELHIGVLKTHSGKGVATSAINLASKYLFEKLRFREIVSFTDVEHLAAQAAFKKSGFSVVKEIKEFYMAPQQPGKKRDVLWLRFHA
jgi:ribosomal-protein-alanine N-acetyltransferase